MCTTLKEILIGFLSIEWEGSLRCIASPSSSQQASEESQLALSNGLQLTETAILLTIVVAICGSCFLVSPFRILGFLRASSGWIYIVV
jgi:hypothetical protein